MSRTLAFRCNLGLLWALAVSLSLLGPTVSADPASRRFVGLERLYFEHLEDPATAGGGVSAYLVEPLRRLLPATLEEGEGPRSEPLVVKDLDGPIHSGLELKDFPLPGPTSGSGSFLRQVVDGTHPRLHSQFWAIYAGGLRRDLWYFTPYDPERISGSEGAAKVLAPMSVEEILSRPDGSFVLRVSGSVFRPLGAGWLYGTELVFSQIGAEMRYLYAVRRYSFDFGYDQGEEERHALVGFEEVGEAEGERMLLRRIYDGILAPDRFARCGFDVTETGFPRGDFDKLVEIARCITAWPEATTEQRSPETPSYLERGWVRKEVADARGQERPALGSTDGTEQEEKK